MDTFKTQLRIKIRLEILDIIKKFPEDNISMKTRSKLIENVKNLESILMDERLFMRWMDGPGEPCKRCKGTGVEP